MIDEMSSRDDKRVKHFKLFFKCPRNTCFQNKEEGKLFWWLRIGVRWGKILKSYQVEVKVIENNGVSIEKMSLRVKSKSVVEERDQIIWKSTQKWEAWYAQMLQAWLGQFMATFMCFIVCRRKEQ